MTPLNVMPISQFAKIYDWHITLDGNVMFHPRVQRVLPSTNHHIERSLWLWFGLIDSSQEL